jgi:steroid delta-isomerase-like uncharacterized protein
MASRNVETLRTAHESWNRRDFDSALRNTPENVVYTDHARNVTLSNQQQLREWLQAWARSMSDGRVRDAQYIDAGDIVVAQFTGEGTNDGPFAGLPSTGRRISFPFCEIWRFDKNGRMISGGCYYDLYTILTKLGHVQPLAAAA